MEIIKAFENNEVGMHITIKGTPEEPLFRASDVAAVFEITNIRQNISDFDNTEKVVCLTYTPGGEQEAAFLTEFGLYEIIFRSRKPIAKQFKKWVCEVIKEIRLNGKYQLEQQLADTEQKLINSKEITLLETYGNSRGVYLGFVDNYKQEVKFGRGIVGDRVKAHKKELGNEFCLQYIIETIYDRELEQLIKIKFKDKIISKDFQNRKATCRELIKLSHDYTIENLYNDILKLKKTLKDDLIKSQKLIISDLKQKLNKYEEDEELSDEDDEDDEEKIEKIVTNIQKDEKPKRKMPLALTEKLKKKVFKFKIEPFSLVSSFNSITEAAEVENIDPVTLTRRINVGTNINGFIWSFSNEKPKEFFSTKNTIIYKYDSELKLLYKYPSIAEASRIENIVTSKLQRLCRTHTLFNGVIYSKTINPVNIKIPTVINGKAVNKINVSNGQIIQTFESATEAALDAGVYQSAISRRIKNNTIIDGIQYKFVVNN